MDKAWVGKLTEGQTTFFAVELFVATAGLMQLLNNQASACVDFCTPQHCQCYWSGGSGNSPQAVEGRCYSHIPTGRCNPNHTDCNNTITCRQYCAPLDEVTCNGGGHY